MTQVCGKLLCINNLMRRKYVYIDLDIHIITGLVHKFKIIRFSSNQPANQPEDIAIKSICYFSKQRSQGHRHKPFT